MKLSELGEERLLRKLLPHLPSNSAVVLGAGDDCAVVRFSKEKDLLLKTDCVVEKVHFRSDAKPSAVGWKAMARPLSDFAAMAGVPQFALVTLIAPAETTLAWTQELYRGLAKAARRFSVAIVGGETSGSNGPITVSVSLTGVVEKDRWISRSGGKEGDQLFVTGILGGSQRGHHLRFTPRLMEARWLAANFRPHAMMDLSDGLGADLPRLARASRLGFEVTSTAIPRNRGCTVGEAISDGEDFELLFALPAREREKLQDAWKKKFPSLPLSCIGKLTAKSKARNSKLPSGYVHFQ
ncbi:MAG: thiamine-phosphate kinase [Chthoniobacterales bacterium]